MEADLGTDISVSLRLTSSIAHTQTVEEIYAIALDALSQGLGVTRSAILLFDDKEVMRFSAWRGLSDEYRRAVEGHSPWRPGSPNPQPVVVPDVTRDDSMAEYTSVFAREGIAALAFFPLVGPDRVIGKFMVYYDTPYTPTLRQIQLAGVIASQVAFAVERTRVAAAAHRSEQRLRFALDAAAMGTWDWNLKTNQVRWSDNLEALHGLPPGTFDGSFASYEREIHPDDRAHVFASVQRSLTHGTPHQVEYRIVAPDGTVRWVEGKGTVEVENGVPVRMGGVCMMVTSRKENELARLAAAEEASRVKDEFLATLSHELRTPLNAIVGWVQMLQVGSLTAERTAQAIDVIGRNAHLQAQLIEDILDVSRIITGKLVVDRLPVFVTELVDLVVADLSPAADAKRITVTKVGPRSLPLIEGDPKRLTQVLNNVVSNAIKFTNDGGRVIIRSALVGSAIEVKVQDSGVGIAPEFLPHAFDRFRQGDSRSTRQHGGLGLGLAISRHLLELHGGSITARSPGRGRGTTITMRLPFGEIVGPPEMSVAVARTPVDLRMEGSVVLVVDDQRDSRELVGAVLEDCGAHVVLCDRAADALNWLRATPADLIVADLAMPEIDGYDLIRHVRAFDHRIPAVAVSAYTRPEDRGKAMASGFDAYCPKPIDTQGFMRLVHTALHAR